MPSVRCQVNGRIYEDEIEPRLLLVHYLRDGLGLTGTKIGCDTSNCGACTVHVDGYSVKSCSLLAIQADGAAVTTIEGLGGDARDRSADLQSWHPVQRAFHTEHGLQCGYCTPGMIMATIDLLRETPNPTEEEIRHGLEGNLCRCTGYHNILAAVRVAAEELAPHAPGPPPPGSSSQRTAVGRSGDEVVADASRFGRVIARLSPGEAPGRLGNSQAARYGSALAGVVIIAVAVRLLWRARRSACR